MPFPAFPEYTLVSFRRADKVGDKRKRWKIDKIKDASRGKNLIDSCWVKLKYIAGIFALVLRWKGTCKRMMKGTFKRTFWVLVLDFLSHYCSASTCNHCYPWILRVWLRSSVCLLSALLYLYRNESTWKWSQDIHSRMMSVLSYITQFMTSSSCRELTTFFAKKMYTQIWLTQS